MGKIELHGYDKDFIKVFRKERDRIKKVLPECKIYHIGSTAVPGLGGKGIVDVMVALKNWDSEKEVVAKLKGLGFGHIHPKKKGRIFLSRVGPTKYKDVHIHLVKEGGRHFREILSFRDYLRKNKKEARRYGKLKVEWIEKAKGDRDKYGEWKAECMKEVLEKI